MGKIDESILSNRNENNIELSSGASEDFKCYNIYDMAGNVWEWTTETVNHSDNYTYGALRGNAFCDGRVGVAGVNGSCKLDWNNVDIGFRVVLYLK